MYFAILCFDKQGTGELRETTRPAHLAYPIYASFWHTALVRYVDFMDNFLARTETCHTADNFGGALTLATAKNGMRSTIATAGSCTSEMD